MRHDDPEEGEGWLGIVYVWLSIVAMLSQLYESVKGWLDKKKEDKSTIEDLQELLEDLTEKVAELNRKLDEAIAGKKPSPRPKRPAKPRRPPAK